jgi:hypothetical protein
VSEWFIVISMLLGLCDAGRLLMCVHCSTVQPVFVLYCDDGEIAFFLFLQIWLKPRFGLVGWMN